MTMAMGWRFIVVDGVERWKDTQVTELAAVLADPPPDTTIAFFAREDTRAKAPGALHAAVKAAGGDVAAEGMVKPWELPRWAVDRARELEIELEPAAAKLLVRHVGERQQRLLRELEKMALEVGPGGRIGQEEVEALAALSAERKVWTLADALVAADRATAVRCLLELRAQGERLPSLLYSMVKRLREAHDVARRLEEGESPAQVKKDIRLPSKAAARLVADARRTDPDRLRHAITVLADLEIASRGGGHLSEDTAALLAVEEAAA